MNSILRGSEKEDKRKKYRRTFDCLQRYRTFLFVILNDRRTTYEMCPHVELNDRAALLFKAGKLEEAVVLLKESIRLRPNNSTSNGNLGETLFWLGRYEDSAAAFERAAALEPTNSLYHNAIGAVYAKLGRYADGIAAIERAIAIDRVGGYYHNLATLLVETGEAKRALPMFEKAVALEPTAPSFRNSLARVCLRLSKNVQAIAELEKSLEFDQNQANVRIGLARIYLKQGNREKALVHYQRLKESGSPLATELFAALSKDIVVRVPEQ